MLSTYALNGRLGQRHRIHDQDELLSVVVWMVEEARLPSGVRRVDKLETRLAGSEVM
jgi:hypothetical protein